LGVLIGATHGYRCVGMYETVEEGLRGLARAPADVLLLDIHLPGMLGSDGVRVLRERFRELQILMLTVYDEEEKIFESICNGACGYLLKKTPPARLLEADQRCGSRRISDVAGSGAKSGAPISETRPTGKGLLQPDPGGNPAARPARGWI
jgi:DNA-binding NarL/FixJ family response regulator